MLGTLVRMARCLRSYHYPRIILGGSLVLYGIYLALSDNQFLFKLFVSLGLLLIGFLCLSAGLRLKPVPWLVSMSGTYWVYFTVTLIILTSMLPFFKLTSSLGLRPEAGVFIVTVALSPLAYWGDEIISFVFGLLVGKEIVAEFERQKQKRLSDSIRRVFYYLGLTSLFISRVAQLGGREAIKGLWAESRNVILEALLFFLVLDTYMTNFHHKLVSPMFNIPE